MNFLKRIGMLILKGVEIYTGFSPIATAAFPGAADKIQTVSHDLAQIADIIVTVEAMGQALGNAGPEKLKAAAPLVAQIVLKSSVLVGKEVSDPVVFARGAQKMADGMADILNSIKEK